MRRTTFDKLLGSIGAGLGVALLAAGGLLLGLGLRAQHRPGAAVSPTITSAPAAAFAHPKAGARSRRHRPVGQPVRGPAAADRPAGRGLRRQLHRRARRGLVGGKTYAQLSAPRHLGDRCAHHARPRPEAADLLGRLACRIWNWRPDRGPVNRGRRAVQCRVRRDGPDPRRRGRGASGPRGAFGRG